MRSSNPPGSPPGDRTIEGQPGPGAEADSNYAFNYPYEVAADASYSWLQWPLPRLHDREQDHLEGLSVMLQRAPADRRVGFAN